MKLPFPHANKNTQFTSIWPTGPTIIARNVTCYILQIKIYPTVTGEFAMFNYEIAFSNILTIINIYKLKIINKDINSTRFIPFSFSRRRTSHHIADVSLHRLSIFKSSKISRNTWQIGANPSQNPPRGANNL